MRLGSTSWLSKARLINRVSANKQNQLTSKSLDSTSFLVSVCTKTSTGSSCLTTAIFQPKFSWLEQL
jgi:hypothetical protein